MNRVTKYLIISLFIISVPSFSQSIQLVVSETDTNYILENFHSDKENSIYYNVLKKYGDSDNSLNYFLIEPLLNSLSNLYNNNRDKYWKCIEIVSRAKIEKFGTQIFHNPLKEMIDIDDFISFKKTTDLVPSLLRTPDDYWSGSYQTPLAYAVVNGKEKWFDYIVSLGVNVNEQPHVYGKGYESNYQMNLLSAAKNEYIKSRLIELGIKQIAKSSWESYSKEDNVRLRDSHSLSSNVLGKIMKGDKFQVIGHTFEFFTLPDGSIGRWVNIMYKEKQYWIWSEYVWEYER